MKKRILYILLIIIAALLGIASRKYSESLPYFLAEYAGDTFWAMAAYFVMRFIWINLSILLSAVYAFLFSVLIEISQLYHANWIDSIRNTIIGGLILGFGFRWADLSCYFFGVLLGVIIDLLTRSINKQLS